MAFQPLTEDQYNKAIAAGFSADDIIKNEKQRQAGGAGGPPAPAAPSLGQKALNLGKNLLPVGGAILGGIGGGAAGLALGGPVGAYAGAVAGAGIGGAAGEAGKEALQGKALSPGAIAKTGAGYGAAEAVGGPVLSIAGKGIEAAGAGLGKFFIPKSAIEASMLRVYKASNSLADRVAGVLKLGGTKAPTTSASAAFDKGVMGPESWMGDKATRVQKQIWEGLIQPALKQSKEKVDIPSFLAETKAQIIKENPELTRQKALLGALKTIQKDYAKTGKISLEKLQDLKVGWADPVPDKAYAGDYVSSAVNTVRDMLAGNARTKIYNALGDDVKQAYLDHGALNGIIKLGDKARAGGVVKAGGTGSLAKQVWEMATVPVGTIGGQVLYKVGQIAEFAGKPGARTLRDLFFAPAINAASQSNSGGQVAPPPQTQPAPTPAIGAPTP